MNVVHAQYMRSTRSESLCHGVVTKLALLSDGDHAFHVRPGVSKFIDFSVVVITVCHVHHHGRRYPELSNNTPNVYCAV